MKLLYTLPLIAFLFVIIDASKGQTVPLASGGNATGSGGKISFSVGQIANLKVTGSNGSNESGIQQPYEIFLVTAINENKSLFNATVFPNPATDFITLSISSKDIKDLSYTLTDIEGKVLYQHTVTSPVTDIDVSAYATGVYFLNILTGENQIQSYKILKNK